MTPYFRTKDGSKLANLLSTCNRCYYFIYRIGVFLHLNFNLNNMKTILRISAATILFFTMISGAQAQFTLSGEFRPRAEFSHGYKTLAAEDQHASFFISQRTRLNFNYAGEKLKTGLVLQDVRNWGSQPQLVGNEDFATSIHQAWLEYYILPELSFKAGRMNLSYDNQRMLGSVGWAQQARSHDLLLIKYEGLFKLHAGVAYHENSDRSNNFYLGPDAYKTMQFLWANHSMGELKMSLLFLNNGVPVPLTVGPGGVLIDQGISFSQTVGPLVNYSTGKLGFVAGAYYQGGQDAAENSLSAFYGNLEASLKPMEKLGLKLGYEYLSGTAFDEPDKNHSFTPFYGTNHKFNGFMDYFYVGNHGNNVGLQDLYLNAGYGLGSLNLNAGIHLFQSAALQAADAGKYLGTEVDLVCSWKLDEAVGLSAGYSQMFAGESMELLKGGSANAYQGWAWLMITVKPTFFSTGGS